MEFRAEVLEAKRRRRAKQVAARPRSIGAERVTWMIGLLVTALLLGVGTIPTTESVTGVALVRDARTRVVHAAVAGAVVAVYVEPGQVVEASDVLVRLSDPVVEVEHAAAATRVEQALVSVLRDRWGSRADGSARAAVDELVRTHAALELQTIRADTAGVIAGVRVAPGDEVEARASLVSVREPGPPALVATIDLPAEAIEKVELGDEVLVSFGEGHEAKRRFEVTAMAMETLRPDSEASADLEPGSSTWRVWARYADARSDRTPPKPGMEGRAELIYGERSLFAALAEILWSTEAS